MAIELRDYQRRCITDLRAAYRAGATAPVLVAPCGAGKTVMFTYMTQQAVARGLKVLIAAHRHELVSQISDALAEWDVPHGMVVSGRRHTDAKVQVASVQTLVGRQRRDPQGQLRHDLVIIDEAHHVTRGSCWGQAFDHNIGAKRLGVTATPSRLDGRGLGMHCGGYFDALVQGPSVLDLIERGYLSPPTVFRPPADRTIDTTGIRIRGGDYVQSALEGLMNTTTITGDAVSHYRKHVDRQPAAAFCVTVRHAEQVREQFARAGYQAAVLTGKTPDVQRRKMIDDLRRSKLHIITSCNVISEGTDIPVLAAAILLRPTASYSLAMQQMGRALRTYPGKGRSVILDHAGNTARHGLPTDDVEWTLDGKSNDAGPTPTKQCMVCYAVNRASVRVCEECGHEFPVSEAPPKLIDMKAGDLEEVDAVAESKRRRREQGSKQSMEDLIALGVARGYKNPRGWAWHVMHARGKRT